MKILVVGATGQLGYAICRKLSQSDQDFKVSGSYRKTSDSAPLKKLPGVNLELLDLLDPGTFEPALKNKDVLIITAATATPTQKADNFKDVDTLGVKKLIDQAAKNKLSQIIYVSAFPFSGKVNAALAKAKMEVEQHLKKSGVPYTIIQPTAFMEVYFPFFGTELPLKGEVVSTVKRPFKFSNNFFNGIKDDMEKKGKFNIIGDGDKKCSYISLENVADYCVNAIGHQEAINKTIAIGGPEILSPLEVKELFEKVYGKNLSLKKTPSGVIKVMGKVFNLFNPAAANIFAMNYHMASHDYLAPNANDTAKKYGVKLITAKDFIASKAKL